MGDNTEAIYWALLTAAVLAFQGVASARPLRRMGILAASLLTNVVNVIVLGTLGAFFYEEGQISLTGVAWFTLLGITAYSYGRIVYYKALHTIGPPRLATMMSTAPILSLLLAVLFLAERPGVGVLAGTALVIAGVILVSYEPTDEGWFHRGILWGFASALSLGVSTFIRKRASRPSRIPCSPSPGPISSRSPFCTAFARSRPPACSNGGGRSTVIVIVLLAVLNSANQVFMNLAVQKGDISVVAPIITSAPIFSLLLTAVFLRDIERVRPAMAVGVLATVAGMVFIAFGR